ncbi:hypothetical protein AX16_004806 [Volvariella volvacea WC 439]|nr:hypothetical protein AX16_004806 [Volvariella volvacea WC 439]
MAPATLALHYVTLDVFTTTRYQGNPLAIVHVPKNEPALSQEVKQKIAREFNFSETVFLHEELEENGVRRGAEEAVRIDIFTTHEELPFAGHPTVGSGWYLAWRALASRSFGTPGGESNQGIRLKTKAGEIPVTASSERDIIKIRLQVPTDFKIHRSYNPPQLKSVHQTSLIDADYVNGKEGEEALASIVKGMTFSLMELTSEEALGRLRPFPERMTAPGLGEWEGFVGLYTFWVDKDNIQTQAGGEVERVRVRTRMFDGIEEDPATGSAASTLAGWLAKKRASERGVHGRWRFDVVQGVEMGRRSEITVFVEIRDDGEIGKIELEGTAVLVMQGTLVSPSP